MIRTARWLLPLVLVAGCTATPVADPAPSPPPASVAPSPASCAVAGVTLGKAANPEQMFLDVMKQTIQGGTVSETELVNTTFTPSLALETSPAPDDDEVMAAVGVATDQSAGLATEAPADKSESVATMLQSLDRSEDSVILGYTSIVTADHAVTVACEAGGTAVGTLSTWDDHETGIVSCDEQPPRSHEAARAAFDQYCTEE